MELFEVFEQLKQIQNEKEERKAKRALDDLITELYDYFISENICPECGCELEEHQSYHVEHGYRETDDIWLKCENCGQRYDYE